MSVSSFELSEVLSRIQGLSAIATTFHASLYRVSENELVVVLRQPNEPSLPSPYSTKDQCLIWFPSRQPEPLSVELTNQHQGVKRIYLVHSDERSLLSVRVCQGPPRFTPVADRRVTCYLLLEPPLSHEEWLTFGNTWICQVLVNYDLFRIFTESDIDAVCERLSSTASFYLSVRRYEGDSWDMLCDRHGCSISYVNFSMRKKLFSVNPTASNQERYVERFVEEIGENTESDIRFIVPAQDIFNHNNGIVYDNTKGNH